MREKIRKLLESESATLKVNNFISLTFYKFDAVGNEVNNLIVESSIEYAFDNRRKVESRDIEGIVKEVEDFIEYAFTEAIESYKKQVRAGYVGEVKEIQ